MTEITLNKNDLLQIINEEIVRFSEKKEHMAIVDNFANKFSNVFVEALDLSDNVKKDKIYSEVYDFVKKFKKEIIDSTVDPTFLKLNEQYTIISRNKDRNIQTLVETKLKTLNESKEKKNLVLEGDMFFGIEDNTLRLVEYKGKEVFLNIPFLGKEKKFKIFVETNGQVEKVEFGNPGMSIKKSNPNSKDKGVWICKNWNINEAHYPKPSPEYALHYAKHVANKNNYTDWKNFMIGRSMNSSTTFVNFDTDTGPYNMEVWWVAPGQYGFTDGLPVEGTPARLYGEW